MQAGHLPVEAEALAAVPWPFPLAPTLPSPLPASDGKTQCVNTTLSSTYDLQYNCHITTISPIPLKQTLSNNSQIILWSNNSIFR